MLTKQWDTKILGMTKVYKKDKRLLETEMERHIPFHQTSQPPNTVVNNINENLESASNKTCHCREETRNVQTAYQKNWQSTQKPETTTNEISGEKIQPKIINLSKHHLTEFQILLLTKEATFCPTTK